MNGIECSDLNFGKHISLLKNFSDFWSLERREALLLRAGLGGIIPKVNLDLPAESFVSLLLQELYRYGGVPAIDVLLKTVASQLGEDVNEEIREIQLELSYYQKSKNVGDPQEHVDDRGRLKVYVSYVKHVDIGRIYPLNIDFNMLFEGISWLITEEEIAIYCEIETDGHMEIFPINSMAVLHRFGGTYGPAEFLLIAANDGEIKLNIRFFDRKNQISFIIPEILIICRQRDGYADNMSVFVDTDHKFDRDQVSIDVDEKNQKYEHISKDITENIFKQAKIDANLLCDIVIRQIKKILADCEQKQRHVLSEYDNLRVQRGGFDLQVRTYQKQLETLDSQVNQIIATDELLQVLKTQIQTEAYQKINQLTENELLSQSVELNDLRDIQIQTCQIRDILLKALNETLDRAKAHGVSGGFEREAARYTIEKEVLIRYPDYPPARDLQLTWARQEIFSGWRSAKADYREWCDHVNTIELMFWDNMPGNQDHQTQARRLIETIELDHHGLQEADKAIKQLVDLPQVTDFYIERCRRIVTQRRIQRSLLRLRAHLYCNHATWKDEKNRHASDILAESNIKMLNQLQIQWEILETKQEIFTYLAAKRWSSSEWTKHILLAREIDSIYPRTRRLRLLIRRLEDMPSLNQTVDTRLRKLAEDLYRLRSDHSGNDDLLRQVFAQIHDLNDQLDREMLIKYHHADRYAECKQGYLDGWQRRSDLILTRWREAKEIPEPNPELIARLDGLVKIAPDDPRIYGVRDELIARASLSRAVQHHEQAELQQTNDWLSKANKLLPDDHLNTAAQTNLDDSYRVAAYWKQQAISTRQQFSLNEAHIYIQRTLEANREDTEAVRLKHEIDAAIEHVQKLARIAHQHEQVNLEQAVQQWVQVCQQHRDGQYPAGSADAQDLTIWRDNARKRQHEAEQHIPQLEQELQSLCDWLAGQQDPDWEEFESRRQRLIQAIRTIEKGMQHQLDQLTTCLKLLKGYSDCFQHLDGFLIKPAKERRSVVWKGDCQRSYQALCDALKRLEQPYPQVYAALRTSFASIEDYYTSLGL